MEGYPSVCIPSANIHWCRTAEARCTFCGTPPSVTVALFFWPLPWQEDAPRPRAVPNTTPPDHLMDAEYGWSNN